MLYMRSQSGESNDKNNKTQLNSKTTKKRLLIINTAAELRKYWKIKKDQKWGKTKTEKKRLASSTKLMISLQTQPTE